MESTECSAESNPARGPMSTDTGGVKWRREDMVLGVSCLVRELNRRCSPAENSYSIWAKILMVPWLIGEVL